MNEVNNIPKIVGENLSYWLKERNHTQLELAKKMNVSAAAVNKWIAGTSLPSTDKLIAISNWLLIDVNQLFKVTNNKSIDYISFKLDNDIDFRNMIEVICNFDEDKLKDLSKYIQFLQSRD